jgi:YggT family protein
MRDIVQLLNAVFFVLNALIIVRVILSWIPGVGFDHPVVRIVHQLTSPILDPIRRLMPSAGGLDLSPLVAVLLLSLIQKLLFEVLLTLGP